MQKTLMSGCSQKRENKRDEGNKDGLKVFNLRNWKNDDVSINIP